MRARSLILIAVAILLAGGTALLAHAWLASQKVQHAAAGPIALPKPTPARSVLVARAGITRGQILKPSDFAWQNWPKDGVNKAYIVTGMRTPQSFAGWVAHDPIAEGEPVTLADIIAPGDRGFLAAVLRPGMRAVSVPVTATSGISGFVFPGDRVDVLITHVLPSPKSTENDAGPQYEHKAAETVLHDVRVIGVDQETETAAGKAFVAHTATLEVDPEQARVVALATEIGKLSLSLRSLRQAPVAPTGLIAASAVVPGDSVKPADHLTYTLDSDVSKLLPKWQGIQAHPDQKPDAGVVTILRGGQKSEEAKVSQPASRGS